MGYKRRRYMRLTKSVWVQQVGYKRQRTSAWATKQHTNALGEQQVGYICAVLGFGINTYQRGVLGYRNGLEIYVMYLSLISRSFTINDLIHFDTNYHRP